MWIWWIFDDSFDRSEFKKFSAKLTVTATFLVVYIFILCQNLNNILVVSSTHLALSKANTKPNFLQERRQKKNVHTSHSLAHTFTKFPFQKNAANFYLYNGSRTRRNFQHKRNCKTPKSITKFFFSYFFLLLFDSLKCTDRCVKISNWKIPIKHNFCFGLFARNCSRMRMEKSYFYNWYTYVCMLWRDVDRWMKWREDTVAYVTWATSSVSMNVTLSLSSSLPFSFGVLMCGWITRKQQERKKEGGQVHTNDDEEKCNGLKHIMQQQYWRKEEKKTTREKTVHSKLLLTHTRAAGTDHFFSTIHI